MPEKTFAEVWLLGPWTGFVFNTVGLILTGIGVYTAAGAKSAARKTEQKMKNFDRSVNAVRMVEMMGNLKNYLRASNFDSASPICDQLRADCVRLKNDSEFIDKIGFLSELDSLITFFGSTEQHISTGVFSLNIEAFNEKSDILLTITEKVKELNKNESSS